MEDEDDDDSLTATTSDSVSQNPQEAGAAKENSEHF